jgi:2-dehydropantoate 2-reductase
VKKQAARLSVLIFGAGAIGTYLGGTLALHGHQVVFLERPEKFPELKDRGFTIHRSGEVFHLPDPLLAPDPEAALSGHRFDLAIYALKTYHIDRVISDLSGLRGRFPPVLCLQNGIGIESRLAEALGWERILPGTITTAVSKTRTGVVTVENQRGIGLGGDHPLTRELMDVLQAAGLSARRYPDWQAMKWSKLYTNLIGNASSAILDMTPSEIYRSRAGYQLEIRQLNEALAVMKSLDLQPVHLPGIPVRLLSGMIRILPGALGRPVLSRILGGGRGGKMPSFHTDLESGSEVTEVGWLNGAVVRHGKQCGTPTPTNKLLTETLQQLTRGDLPRRIYAGKPGKLLAELKG